MSHGHKAIVKTGQRVKLEWNKLFLPVDALRECVRPFCEKSNLNPNDVVGDSDYPKRRHEGCTTAAN